MPVTRIVLATPTIAARQAAWISTMDPWRGLGYSVAALRAFLRRSARAKDLFIATDRATARATAEPVLGLLVLQRRFLLGNFVSLLAVRPDSSRRGIGRTLMARADRETLAKHRWLFVSADTSNREALRFYRKLGFVRVGRLPDLVRPGRIEILLRKGRSS